MHPYIIYENTLFIRKIKGGFELLPGPDGVLPPVDLPDEDVIKLALSKAGKPFPGKKKRFALVSVNGQDYEAMPHWGVVAANLNRKPFSAEDVHFLLTRDRVQSIVYVDDDGTVSKLFKR